MLKVRLQCRGVEAETTRIGVFAKPTTTLMVYLAFFLYVSFTKVFAHYFASI